MAIEFKNPADAVLNQGIKMLIFGAAMVLMMVWRPQGLMPMRRIHIELKKQE